MKVYMIRHQCLKCLNFLHHFFLFEYCYHFSLIYYQHAKAFKRKINNCFACVFAFEARCQVVRTLTFIYTVYWTHKWISICTACMVWLYFRWSTITYSCALLNGLLIFILFLLSGMWYKFERNVCIDICTMCTDVCCNVCLPTLGYKIVELGHVY